MFAVQPGGLRGAKEKLAAVGIRSGVCHREDSGARVCELEVLICELVAVDTLASCSSFMSKIATLTHELRYDAVEWRAFLNENIGRRKGERKRDKSKDDIL